MTLEVSETAVKNYSSVTFTCRTSSNPFPRLRLYRQREGQAASEVKAVTGVTLSWTNNVMPVDNKAEFHCRVDDNENIDGWNFDVQSEQQQLTVWCKYNILIVIVEWITKETLTDGSLIESIMCRFYCAVHGRSIEIDTQSNIQ